MTGDERVFGPDGPLTLDEQVGSGAEGAVYSVEEATSTVTKIFDSAKRDGKAAKVRAMIANPPDDPTDDESGIKSIIWPTGIVEDASGAFLGYLMPYKEVDDHRNIQRYTREELQWHESTPQQRYGTVLNLVKVVDAIHSEGHAIGDMNYQNILVKNGIISLIDCDAFTVDADGTSFEGDTFHGRYAPPEGRGKTIADVRLADRFGLGIHLFQLLMEEFHPYQAVGPNTGGTSIAEMIRENPFPYGPSVPNGVEPPPAAPIYDRLPGSVKNQFELCFRDGKTDPKRRPDIDSWLSTFETLVDDRSDDWTTKTGTERSTETGSATTETMGGSDTAEASGRGTTTSGMSTKSDGTATTSTTTTGIGGQGTSRSGTTGSTSSELPSESRRPSVSKQRVSRAAGGLVSEVKRTLYYIAWFVFLLFVGYGLLTVL